MHTERDYSAITDGTVARRTAINDLIGYIGIRRTKYLIRAARCGDLANLAQFNFVTGFAGVSGFPVRALWFYATGRNKREALLSYERELPARW